jgi:acetolactate synthase-1/2/3 large subunit
LSGRIKPVIRYTFVFSGILLFHYYIMTYVKTYSSQRDYKMTANGGDIIADVLKKQGVRFLFTLCGGHISPILVSSRHQGIRVIDVRHEANAVFAADAVARLTGAPGVAAVTAGPGVTNTVTALKNAQMAQSPLILLGGAAGTVLKGRGSLQDIDQITLVKSIVKTAVTINRNCDIVPVLAYAFKTARSNVPGPVFVECPIDLLYDEATVRNWYGLDAEPTAHPNLKSKLFQFSLERHVNRIFACDFDKMETVPPEAETPEEKEKKVVKAAKILSRAKQPLMIIGSQAMLHPSASQELADAVEGIGMPIFLTGMARGLMGKSHSLQIRHKRKEALKSADVVLLAGMPSDFRLDYGRSINPKASLININRSKTDLFLNRRPSLAIHGDPFHHLKLLAHCFSFSNRSAKKPWIDRLKESDARREREIDDFAQKDLKFVNPLLFLRKLDGFLNEDSVIVADGGDFVGTASYILRPRSPLSWLDPGVFGTLGVGAGFAMGAKLSRPDSEIWLIYGDGAAGYSLQEFDTYTRLGIPVIAVVGNDAGWTQIARYQVEVLKDDVATVLRHSDYHKVAEGFGGKGLLVKEKDQIGPALRTARDAAGKGIPVLINVLLGKTDFRKGSISM